MSFCLFVFLSSCLLDFLAHHCIPLHTIVYHCTPLHTIAHDCTPLHTIAHDCIPLHTIAHHCTPLHTIAHHCTPLHTIVYHCTPLHTRFPLPHPFPWLLKTGVRAVHPTSAHVRRCIITSTRAHVCECDLTWGCYAQCIKVESITSTRVHTHPCFWV